MLFEEFPTEIIHHIFDYLSGDQLINAFLNLNSHFDQIIRSIHLKTIDLSSWKYRDLTVFIKRTLPFISKSAVSFILGNSSDPISGRLLVNGEFLFALLIEENDLKLFWRNLQQIIFIRPIIEENILLNEDFLQRFFIETTREKLVLKKQIGERRISNLFICNTNVIRKFCYDFGGIYDETLSNIENDSLTSVVSRVRHLKVFIDHFAEQWPKISKLIGSNLDELTLIIFDQQFDEFLPDAFASLLSDLRDDCRLNFFLQVSSRGHFFNLDIETMTNEFSSDFYTRHQCHVTVVQLQQTLMRYSPAMLIYTSPICVSNLLLSEFHQLVGTETDFDRLTRLTFNGLSQFHSVFPLITVPLNRRFPQLNSLEFSSASSSHYHRGNVSLKIFLNQIRSQIGHIHLNHFSTFLKYQLDILREQFWSNLQRLEITDDSFDCSIFATYSNLTSNIQHLIINESCRLLDDDVRNFQNFPKLKTLKFTVKLGAKYTEQLNTIGEVLLINMKTHLNYLHVVFHQDNLLIMPMEPSVNQLSEWLGHNQRYFSHILAIELNQQDLFVWM